MHERLLDVGDAVRAYGWRGGLPFERDGSIARVWQSGVDGWIYSVVLDRPEADGSAVVDVEYAT